MIIDPKKVPITPGVSSENNKKSAKPQPASLSSESRQVEKPQFSSNPAESGRLLKSPTEGPPVRPLAQAISLPEKSLKRSPIAGEIRTEKPDLKSRPSGDKQARKKILAVGGAKGGVGKSMLAANLAVGLALLGQKVVLADLDLGGADVHLYTGVKALSRTWNDFLEKKVDSIKDILTPTAFEGLSLIGGDSSKLGSANLPYSQKLKIMRHLKELKTDYLVVDLGGDTTYNGLDFFLLADQKIVVSGTEPASVLDSYTFVKVVFNRLLERFFTDNKRLKDLSEKIKDGSLEKSKDFCLDYLYGEVRARDPLACAKLKRQFDQFRLSIVLNMTESSKDIAIAQSMQKLVKDRCFLDIGILGTIPFEKAVRKAARGFTPIVVENPKCHASRNIHQMLAAIILDREDELTQVKLLHQASRIRREAKNRINSGKMTLDGLTVEQINAAFNDKPNLRQSFNRILKIVSG